MSATIPVRLLLNSITLKDGCPTGCREKTPTSNSIPRRTESSRKRREAALKRRCRNTVRRLLRHKPGHLLFSRRLPEAPEAAVRAGLVPQAADAAVGVEARVVEAAYPAVNQCPVDVGNRAAAMMRHRFVFIGMGIALFCGACLLARGQRGTGAVGQPQIRTAIYDAQQKIYYADANDRTVRALNVRDNVWMIVGAGA